MAREAKRLTARTVATIGPGLHADGDNLYLRVEPTGARRWVFIFRWQGKRTEMGLGRLTDIGLADARERAADARRQIVDGRHPIEVRKAAVAAARPIPTFGQMADDFIADHESSFRNDKHIAQWRMTLGPTYCETLRRRRVDQVSTEDVLAVLKPIWLEKNETASRLRGRIERVLDAAKAKGLRSGENPAAWRGHLKNLLPKRQKLSRGHHKVMPYAQLPAFMERLAESKGMGATALRFLILTAARSGEVVGGKLEEIDLDKAIWAIPAPRMKAGRIHRVALSTEARAIATAQMETPVSEFIFPGNKPKRPITAASMTKALAAAGGGDFTLHGFRSSFRDWVSEETAFPGELAEAALAHIQGDETERAYRRGDALEKRRKLMQAWASYCMSPTRQNVVPIRRSKTPAA